MKRPDEHTAIPVEIVLRSIENFFALKHQWQEEDYSTDSMVSALRSLEKAEALIELLEEYTCGSKGGFDRFKGLLQEEDGRYCGNLHSRFLWLRHVRYPAKGKKRPPR